MDRSNHPKVKPYLVTRSLVPENQETPIHFIDKDTVDENLFYRRNHFSYPTLSYSNYWLPINGLVAKPHLFSIEDIIKLPSRTILVTLECSGDKRSLFKPKVYGEQWEKGAISQAYWKGVPLRFLLEHAGISKGAKEVVVEGYDFGERTDLNQVFTYARSLPIEKALHPDTIVAYEYNHQPIPFKHGYPLRLIVPKLYAMASVKWIKQITVTDSAFIGPFQSIDYVYYPNKENTKDSFPVTTINVNSTIQKPLDREILNTGKHLIKGIAWTGNGSIAKVEISVDGGISWQNAKLETADPAAYGWQSWSHDWTAAKKGDYTIMSKATDTYGRTQPAIPFWNQKGYGYNAIDRIRVKVE